MKILELTNYSAGICGVWNRVKEEALRLSELGHEVKVFSSNLTKGVSGAASEYDSLSNVKIKRFPATKLGGESFMSWKFEKDALAFKPDAIIAHSYRHVHTTKALKIAKKINCKIFLVTHAPFERSTTRSFKEKIAVALYDFFYGGKKLNQFDKILAITRWEIPYLEKLGVKDSKIIYIPNGIPEEFFKLKKSAREKNKVLFLGRISRIKNLEIVIKALPSVKEDFIFEIVGPAEKTYLSQLKKLIVSLNLEKRVVFSKPIFDVKEKIKKIDSAKIFVLPSKSEGMPQSLIEAMARGKIVIASDNEGAKDLIEDKKTGYLFELGSAAELAKIINFALEQNNAKIKKEAKKSVEQFSWGKIIKKLEKLIS